MKKTILNLVIIFIVQRQLRTTAQNIRCQKVDFNRQTSVVEEFGECVGVAPPNVLKINSYSATTITPFRPTSEFHLSAVDGLSCLLSTFTFSLDSFSEIRTAIFLHWDVVGAWVKVQIFDNDGDVIDVIAQSEMSNGWIAYNVKVNRTIENAQIEISTNMNANSIMAMEYLFVLNSELANDECVDEETDPIITDPTDETPPTDYTTEPTDPSEDPSPTDELTDDPTDDPTIDPTESSTIISTEPTDDPFPTEDPTVDPIEPPTTVSPDEPFPTDETTNETENDTSTTPSYSPSTTTAESPRESQSATNVWMGLSILFFATTIIALAGFYYFVWLYRRLLTSMKYVTRSGDVTNTLPRLQVKNSVIDGDSVIVGIDNKY
ncbi:mucin-2-like [Bradysia coprophila]|uniref:mucin-2-like n=1 Tax=Bradysia coprophila TaxID=38358 RepID=UPI00187D80FA|nr:mucin-2-like [Bradysia coprophila]